MLKYDIGNQPARMAPTWCFFTPHLAETYCPVNDMPAVFPALSRASADDPLRR